MIIPTNYPITKIPIRQAIPWCLRFSGVQVLFEALFYYSLWFHKHTAITIKKQNPLQKILINQVIVTIRCIEAESLKKIIGNFTFSYLLCTLIASNWQPMKPLGDSISTLKKMSMRFNSPWSCLGKSPKHQGRCEKWVISCCSQFTLFLPFQICLHFEYVQLNMKWDIFSRVHRELGRRELLLL